MKRERPADDIRRWAIKARLQGISTGDIARHLGRSQNTIKTYLCSCGGVSDGRYHLNALAAKALFSNEELVGLGAVWNGRSWVGPGRISSQV